MAKQFLLARSARLSIIVASVMIVVSATLVLGAVAPAHAAGEILLSPDGITWADTLPVALFANPTSMIPLEAYTSTVYLKNASASPGYLRISLRNGASSTTDYARALRMTITAPGFAGLPIMVGDAQPCITVVDSLRVKPGHSIALTTTLHLGDLTGKVGQNESLDLALVVNLNEAVALTTPRTTCPPDGTSVAIAGTAPSEPFVSAKPWSGTEILWANWLPSVAAIVGVVSFWTLFVARRRRRRNEEESDDELD